MSGIRKHELGRTGEGGEAPSNKRDDGVCVSWLRMRLWLNGEFGGRYEVYDPCHVASG